ncbi:MAG: alpha/beta fold hydrolase [Amphiplicatus sp.]
MTERLIEANALKHFLRDDGPKDAPAAILLHGFPDTADLWRGVTPDLVAGGFRVIAPDLRGFGRTDIPASLKDYAILEGAAPDIIAIVDALGLGTPHLVGHDFGAAVAWALAIAHPDRFSSLAALSLGHPRAFLKAGWGQRRRSWYIGLHHLRGLAEWAYRADDWRLLRGLFPEAEAEARIAMLERPGRLAAALKWYRANTKIRYLFIDPPLAPRENEIVRIPTMGIWSAGDKYLGYRQMATSEAYVEAPWRFEEIEEAGHWIMRDAPARLTDLLLSHWRAH